MAMIVAVAEYIISSGCVMIPIPLRNELTTPFACSSVSSTRRKLRAVTFTMLDVLGRPRLSSSASLPDVRSIRHALEIDRHGCQYRFIGRVLAVPTL